MGINCVEVCITWLKKYLIECKIDKTILFSNECI